MTAQQSRIVRGSIGNFISYQEKRRRSNGVSKTVFKKHCKNRVYLLVLSIYLTPVSFVELTGQGQGFHMQLRCCPGLQPRRRRGGDGPCWSSWHRPQRQLSSPVGGGQGAIRGPRAKQEAMLLCSSHCFYQQGISFDLQYQKMQGSKTGVDEKVPSKHRRPARDGQLT